MQVLDATNIRLLLKDELSKRMEVNPMLSQRAFAKFLGMSPGIETGLPYGAYDRYNLNV